MTKTAHDADAWIIGAHDLPDLGELPPQARFAVTGVQSMELLDGQHVLVHDLDTDDWHVDARADFDAEYEFL